MRPAVFAYLLLSVATADVDSTKESLLRDDVCEQGDCSMNMFQRLSLSTEEKLASMKLLTVNDLVARGNVTALSGFKAPLNHNGYLAVTMLRNDTEMAAFIRRVVSKLQGVISDVVKLHGFVPYYSGTTVVQSFHKMLKELRISPWVKLPPPQAGTVLFNMIRPNPWVCDLFPMHDSRNLTCHVAEDSHDLNPLLVNCGKHGSSGSCGIEHANAYRTNFLVGALPCCPTAPFCAAPACNPEHEEEEWVSCTDRSPEESLRFLRRPDVWPAYHGWGGSFELDTLKLLDVLGCRDNSTGECPTTPVDIFLDLGGDTGHFTEKLTVRKFAKDYVLIRGNRVAADVLKSRWANDTFVKTWFEEQVPQHSMLQAEVAFQPVHAASFEVLNYVLSNVSSGTVNLCNTTGQSHEERGCSLGVSTVDNLIPHQLSPMFNHKFGSAGSAFVKVDTDGMDEFVLRGMTKLLQEQRGAYADSSPKYMVNFIQMKLSPALIKATKERNGLSSYDARTVVKFMESMGFESFLVGPRLVPLSHGLLNDVLMKFLQDAENNAGIRTHYPQFDDRLCSGCADSTEPTVAADVFMIRSSHPRAVAIKHALGACKESSNFKLADNQYTF